MLYETCPICLDEMHQIDFDHPLQCTRHCGYNFCKNCIESLIKSSKDDYCMASDGNCHVKVFLMCPNCRSDLSETIRDTLLLRKADSVIYAKPGERLTESQIRLKSILHEKSVRDSIARARGLEAEALGIDMQKIIQGNEKLDGLFVEEIGFEADLYGIISPSLNPLPPPQPRFCKKTAVEEDPTLLAGMEYFMTKDERIYITELMTSGDPSLLAEAANILFDIAKDVFSTGKSKNQHKRSAKLKKLMKPRPFTNQSSFWELMEEADNAKKKKKNKNSSNNNSRQTQQPGERAQRQNMMVKSGIQNMYPVPVRMPKVIEIQNKEQLELQFIDYEWDGTMMDAYSRLCIGYKGNSVTQKRPSNKRVRVCLDGDGDVQIEMPGKKRVLVSHVGYEAGKQGTMLGDVVTHVNDTSVAEQSSSELLAFMKKKMKKSSRPLKVTFNAEQSVAAALSRRALVIFDH